VYSSLKTVLENAREAYNSKQGEMKISLDYTEPTVTTKSSGIPLLPIAGLVVGLVFAFLIAAVTDRTVRA
jgi:hypothetical protein